MHAALGFNSLQSGEVVPILDLASMQFGDIGRGQGGKGKMLLALDRMEEFEARLENRRLAMVMASPQHSVDHVHRVAQCVKERRGKRATERWCASCVTPDP